MEKKIKVVGLALGALGVLGAVGTLTKKALTKKHLNKGIETPVVEVNTLEDLENLIKNGSDGYDVLIDVDGINLPPKGKLLISGTVLSDSDGYFEQE